MLDTFLASGAMPAVFGVFFEDRFADFFDALVLFFADFFAFLGMGFSFTRLRIPL